MDYKPRLLESSDVFRGRVFGVRTDLLEYEDGTTHRVDVVEHGASLAIAATPSPGKIVLVRQYRHPTGTSLWELPAGTSEPGESPADGARRELQEETGYAAGRLTPIGSFWMTPGFCSEVLHVFHAEELIEGAPAFDEDERIEIGVFTLEAAWRLVANGTADAKTMLGLWWLKGAGGEIGTVDSR
ncbi:MAG TPA: NUDIX hydrolase [Candidatus Cybelea sp.]|jgi:ADP-ribose pyrophosphatase|nr:NUDIX hydrolase [Candidatus Cybelea sp.]